MLSSLILIGIVLTIFGGVVTSSNSNQNINEDDDDWLYYQDLIENDYDIFEDNHNI